MKPLPNHSRPLEKMDADLEKAENEILQLLKEVTA